MSSRPRLTVTAALLARLAERDTLRSAFDLQEVESFSDLLAPTEGMALVDAADLRSRPREEAPLLRSLMSVLEHVGEAVGVVDGAEGLIWANARLRSQDETTRAALVSACQQALASLNQAGASAVNVWARPGLSREFAVGETRYELMMSIAAVDDGDHRVTAVMGILWDVTSSRSLQARIDAIDAAGADLLRLDPTAIARLNMAERLRLLENKIVRAVRDLLDFDHFEIRLIDRQTNQLELVVAIGLAPLRLGEVLLAQPEDNGISGYVAATGEPYVCGDIRRDTRYYEGLPGARSCLTVPLRLDERIIGIFNVESAEPDAFTEEDCRFAELFGRYIALAMHILDLLVVERYTTNAQLGENILGELTGPLDEIGRETSSLIAALGDADPAIRERLTRIENATAGVRRRLRDCTTGPQTILGAERTMTEHDPRLDGKRIIIADNEAVTRDAISLLLRQLGCEVTACQSGAQTIDALRAAEASRQPFDVVISDIRMPDGTGYDVFRSAKEMADPPPVILITGFGYDPDHSVVRAADEGLHSLLFKPVQAEQLIEAVATAVTSDNGR